MARHISMGGFDYVLEFEWIICQIINLTKSLKNEIFIILETNNECTLCMNYIQNCNKTVYKNSPKDI